ncbi:AAA family ATPase [uncultured Methylobacterium sp.]|uniref:AAA family ATPase n=1 Tax=uncultured Methylobacterium sp. TaxID=157278 RepID=UPI0035C946F1
MRPAETITPEHVQGCGDPACPICMRKAGRAGGAKTGGDSFFSADEKEMLKGLLALKIPSGLWPVAVDLGSVNGGNFAAQSNFRPGDRLQAEERRLREPVERYLLMARHGVAWDDVVGNETARQHLVEAIEHPIKHRELYAHYGKKPTKGVLLYGPPGCGKTMFGKAAASVLAELHGRTDGEASLLSIKGPEIQSPYVGVTEEIIRAVFAYARAYRDLHRHPLVVFIDEADAILPSRDGAGRRRAMAFEESNVATFLTEMDGLEESGALVILATNRPDAIDAAILRDGRCDRKIKVERPDRAAAGTILVRALRAVPVEVRTAPRIVELRGGDGSSLGCHPSDMRRLPEDEVRAALAREAADLVFAPDATIAHLATDQGPAVLRLADIVNGAMLVGIVEQAKGNAFRRDLAAGGPPGGITAQDLARAVESVVEQNRGLNHHAAVVELGERTGFTAARVVKTAPDTAPRYTLGPAGDVVRVQ